MNTLTTKVFATEFLQWHYTVLLYDNIDFEYYEMIRPMDLNGVNITLAYWRVRDNKFVDYSGINTIILSIEWDEITMEELMLPENLDIRTAIKNRQESFYPF